MPLLAISFFAFEFIHYLMEVRRGEAPMKNPLDFALFTVFWPSIVAGPLKRYDEFVPPLDHSAEMVCAQDVAEGSLRVAAGLVKKFAADVLRGQLAPARAPSEASPVDLLWCCGRGPSDGPFRGACRGKADRGRRRRHERRLARLAILPWGLLGASLLSHPVTKEAALQRVA